MIFALQRNGRTIQVAGDLFHLEFYQKGDEVLCLDSLEDLLPAEEPKKKKQPETRPVRAKYPGTCRHILLAQQSGT